MDQRKIVTGLFLLSGFTGLVYETVWIRLFALSFGSTAQALSTVAAVYLGGLAIGGFCAGRAGVSSAEHGLRFYGIAELVTGIYALAIPTLLQLTTPWLSSIYATGGNTAAIRAACCAIILFPATICMGATLPWLAAWISLRSGQDARREVASLYARNLVGATGGVLLSGFLLLPGVGFTRTLQLASVLNISIGVAAIIWSNASGSDAKGGEAAPRTIVRSSSKSAQRASSNAQTAPSAAFSWTAIAFLSGFVCMLYEIVWSRISGLLFGPTASTLTLVLGAFLAGLAASAILARRISRNVEAWLWVAQAASVVLLVWAYIATGFAPELIAKWVAAHSGQPGLIELMKIVLLALTITPVAAAAGLTFPLLLRVTPDPGRSYARQIGGLYGINTVGCILGSLLTGWLLIPQLGTQGTVLAGGLLSTLAGLVLLRRIRPSFFARALSVAVALAAIAIFLFPRWDMEAMTAGGYKYAPYAADPALLGRGQLAYLREGVSGTVAVRKSGKATILSIDGKVDATDAGGDLLTEKLLAHIPLLLSPEAKSVCLIGLASGVTAGAALTYPIERLDVLEVSREVVEASHYFDASNRKPLEDPRTKLVLNDGRNHLLLASRQYDVIISEPSNPWIAGMNSLFTQDFFRIAKARLRPNGLFAQWFHIYNMPGDDLRSLLRAFHNEFPHAALWRLNDGDVLLIGMTNPAWPSAAPYIPATVQSDLRSAGVDDAALLWNMYVMRDGDIGRFAGEASPNTDDHPWLEFHGQRDLHAQTDSRNGDELEAFPRAVPDPSLIAGARKTSTEGHFLVNASMFEHAESYHTAYRSYEAALRLNPGSMEALAGMDRCARLPQEREAVVRALGLPGAGADSLQRRTEWALQKAREGDLARARFLFAESAAAYPDDPNARINFGVFQLEQQDFRQAIELFEQAIVLDPSNIPAHEAIAEANLKLRDYPQAAKWSRRILELNPNHPAARQILEVLERESRN